MKKLSQLFGVGFFFLLSSAAANEVIELETAERRTAEATFFPGDNDANPVLILHGFLQTRDFPTVSRLATSLNESGHTVLTPTLTLGLHKRRKSLACEAIHTHNTGSDTAEIAQWIEWLYQKTGKPVTLIGHSSGTQTLLNYLDKHDAQMVNKAVLISISYFSQGPVARETPEHARQARVEINRGRNPLGTYALSYCETYPTRAKDFLSYYEWNREKVASVTSRFSDKVSIILGTSDKRIEDDWRQQLIESKIDVIAIDGANHFFDQAHEFDLLDSMESILENS